MVLKVVTLQLYHLRLRNEKCYVVIFAFLAEVLIPCPEHIESFRAECHFSYTFLLKGLEEDDCIP